jgi:hypothetical protein
VRHFSKIIQEGRFARTGLTGDENVTIGVFHQVKGLLKLLIDFYGCGFGHDRPLKDQEGEMVTPVQIFLP